MSRRVQQSSQPVNTLLLRKLANELGLLEARPTLSRSRRDDVTDWYAGPLREVIAKVFRLQAMMLFARIERGARERYFKEAMPAPSYDQLPFSDQWKLDNALDYWGTVEKDLNGAYAAMHGATAAEDIKKATMGPFWEGVKKGEFDMGEGFALDNVAAQKWLDHNAATMVKGLDNTTSNMLRKALTASREKGKSWNKTKAYLLKKFDAMAPKQPQKHIVDRAMLVAVNETGWAYEAGTKMYMDRVQKAGIALQKSLLTVGDKNVDPHCDNIQAIGWVALDSEEVPLAPLHPACRCTMLYQQDPNAKTPELKPTSTTNQAGLPVDPKTGKVKVGNKWMDAVDAPTIPPPDDISKMYWNKKLKKWKYKPGQAQKYGKYATKAPEPKPAVPEPVGAPKPAPKATAHPKKPVDVPDEYVWDSGAEAWTDPVTGDFIAHANKPMGNVIWDASEGKWFDQDFGMYYDDLKKVPTKAPASAIPKKPADLPDEWKWDATTGKWMSPDNNFSFEPFEFKTGMAVDEWTAVAAKEKKAKSQIQAWKNQQKGATQQPAGAPPKPPEMPSHFIWDEKAGDWVDNMVGEYWEDVKDVYAPLPKTPVPTKPPEVPPHWKWNSAIDDWADPMDATKNWKTMQQQNAAFLAPDPKIPTSAAPDANMYWNSKIQKWKYKPGKKPKVAGGSSSQPYGKAPKPPEGHMVYNPKKGKWVGDADEWQTIWDDAGSYGYQTKHYKDLAKDEMEGWFLQDAGYTTYNPAKITAAKKKAKAATTKTKKAQDIIDEIDAQPHGVVGHEPLRYSDFGTSARRLDTGYGSSSERFNWARRWQGRVDSVWPQSSYKSLRGYTGSGYDNMNAAMRGGRRAANMSPSQRKTYIRKVRSIEQNMSAVDEDVMVTRVASWRSIDKDLTSSVVSQKGTDAVSDEVIARLKPGTKLRDNGLMSTSVRTDFSWSGSVRYNIHVKKGTKATYVEEYSMHSGEMELILAPGTEMQVHSVTKSATGIEVNVFTVPK